MKKLIVVVLLLGFMVGVAQAQSFTFFDAKTLIPASFYDIESDSVLAGVTTPIMEWNELISLEAGMMIRSSKIGFGGGGLSVDLRELAKKVGASYKPLDTIKIGMFFARDFRERNNYYGIYLGTRLRFAKSE